MKRANFNFAVCHSTSPPSSLFSNTKAPTIKSTNNTAS